MVKEFKKKYKGIKKDNCKMTSKMLLAAASQYSRPIIVFSIHNKMAYFEKEYLPLPDLDASEKDKSCGLQKQDEFAEDPIYIYSYGNIRYKLLIHRDQKTVLTFLQSKNVNVQKFIFSPERFQKNRI